MVAFIDAHRDVHGVEPICRLLPIAPSTYFRHKAQHADPDRRSAGLYGLDEVDWARIGSFGGLLSMPFQQEVQPSLTQKSGSGRAYVDNMPT